MVSLARPQKGELAALARHWQGYAAVGAGSIFLGLVAMTSMFLPRFANAGFLGLVLLLAGLLQCAVVYPARRWSGSSLSLFTGLLALVVGVVLLARPLIGASSVTLLLAALFLGRGLALVFTSITQRFEQWGWPLASGVFSALLGLLVLSQWPITAFWFLGLYIGLELIVVGAAWFAAAVLAHRAGYEERGAPVPA
jgi:uncharacterized membrane protein HdeD (DUF308 family)